MKQPIQSAQPVKILTPSFRKKAKTYSVTPEERELLARLSMLITHHQMLIGGMEAQVKAILEPYGVDITRGHWNINLETGELTQKD